MPMTMRPEPSNSIWRHQNCRRPLRRDVIGRQAQRVDSQEVLRKSIPMVECRTEQSIDQKHEPSDAASEGSCHA
jgi:hypothetical protein